MTYEIDDLEKEAKKYTKAFLKEYPSGHVYVDNAYDDNDEVIENQIEITLSVDSDECPYEGFRDAWQSQDIPEKIELGGMKYKRVKKEQDSYEMTCTRHYYERY